MEEQLPDNDDDFQPPKKKRKHRYRALVPKRKDHRKVSPVSGSQLSKAQEKFISGNTKKQRAVLSRSDDDLLRAPPTTKARRDT